VFRKRIGFRRWPWISSSILYLEAGGPYTPPYIRYDVARLSPDMAWWVASTNDTLSSVRCYLPSFSWSATWSLTMCSLKELVQHRGIFPDTHETSVITVNCNCNWNCKILKNNDPVNCNYNCNWEIKKITETEKLNQLSNRKIAITEKFLDCKLSPLKRFRLLAQDDQPFMSHSYCCLQYCWQWTYFILCWQQGLCTEWRITLLHCKWAEVSTFVSSCTGSAVSTSIRETCVFGLRGADSRQSKPSHQGPWEENIPENEQKIL